MMEALVVGGDGLIGHALYKHLVASGIDAQYSSRKSRLSKQNCIYLDLAKPARISRVPDVVFMCAGITNLKQCESDPIGTRKINVDMSVQLMEDLHARGARIVYLSSQAVFDGNTPNLSSDSPTSATIEYGKQKSEVEKCVVEMGEGTAVVRISKVISCTAALIAEWLSSLNKGDAIHPFIDLALSPVSLRYLVSALMNESLKGIVHISNEQQLSYADFASLLAETFDFSADLVQPIYIGDTDIDPIYNPKYTTLDMSRSTHSYGLKPQILEVVMEDLANEFAELKRNQ
jgi:dTDP-4-dehydrorhamnose reductase